MLFKIELVMYNSSGIIFYIVTYPIFSVTREAPMLKLQPRS